MPPPPLEIPPLNLGALFNQSPRRGQRNAGGVNTPRNPNQAPPTNAGDPGSVSGGRRRTQRKRKATRRRRGRKGTRRG